MGIRGEAIARAEVRQQQAAHDDAPAVHVVAGPGTGKSRAIGERIRDLLASGTPADEIRAVSFTNAAVADLREGILDYCEASGTDASQVATSTLHSLALGLLRRANLLSPYPVEPLVLDQQETRDLIDEEFASETDCTLTRAREIREHYEAFANTGQAPPHHARPDDPVTDDEARDMSAFLNRRKAVYGAVLPGEIVRECVAKAHAGAFDPVITLGVQQLVVDEYQDLNPVDIEFIDLLVHGKITTYVCGDDDQSLYGFRHASPEGIQTFPQRHDAVASTHTLEDCFRCSPAILDAAVSVIEHYSGTGRLPKTYRSLWHEAEPEVEGVVDVARHPSPQAESTTIAQAARDMIEAGIRADDILVLMSNQGAQAGALYDAFDAEEVPYSRAREESILGTPEGRTIDAVLRRVVDDADLVAARTLFGLQHGVGAKTCLDLVAAVLDRGISATQVWQVDDASDVFPARVEGARRHVVEGLRGLSEVTGDMTLSDTRAAIEETLGTFDIGDTQAIWTSIVEDLPGDMTIAETLRYVRANSAVKRGEVLEQVLEQLGLPIPEEDLRPPAVQFMSMHGAKGLTAEIVFVPGLEDDLLPGPQRAGIPSEVYEAARLLYVAITRARAACLLSYASTRVVNGQWGPRPPSRYLHSVGPAVDRDDPHIPAAVVDAIVATSKAMAPA